ncbi:hypothetical protein [Cupriavidus sp. BIS7]|uniref:hypothetical protein n=1 Tax=Cupriavidus sp. BIS7 TaxID=1217718 RepID=UPI0002E3D1F3|nr:hypothetical protein [Cupriavidus sp. BIS7]
MFSSGIERLARALTSAYAIIVAQAMVRHLLTGWHREYLWPIAIALGTSLLALAAMLLPGGRIRHRWLWALPLCLVTVVAAAFA